MSGKLMNFDMPINKSSIIKVIGVGGGGSNAVNHMFKEGIKGVDFIVCNTDAQALENSPVPVKIQLGSSLTEGLGAGGNPDVGKNSALENIEQIKETLYSNTKMVFITAGLGGGTGTGGAPVIAATAKSLGILTVGIVTVPFYNEGPKRRAQAEEGLDAMRQSVDAILVICNDKLREMYGNLSLQQAFRKADDVLTTAAKGIAEIITVPGYINVDFEDVKTVMRDSGVAIMGSAITEGEDRAIKAVEHALASPLLNDNNIIGARYVLLNINGGTGKEVLLDEISEINDFVQQEAGSTANVIMGVGTDETLEDKISVTIIASGFKSNPALGFIDAKQPGKIIRKLDEDNHKHKTQPKSEGSPKTDIPVEQKGDKQVSIEFELSPKSKQLPRAPGATGSESMKKHTLNSSAGKPLLSTKNVDSQHTEERIKALKDLSYRPKNNSDITSMENEPAYKRRNVKLDSVPHSSESQISRYTLSENDEENKATLKPNNPFLHDNVD